MVNNDSIIADDATLRKLLGSVIGDEIDERIQSTNIRNEIAGVEIAKVVKWYHGINLIQISLNNNYYWASINYLFHDGYTSTCNLPMGTESTDDDGASYITPLSDIYVNVLPYSPNNDLDYLIIGFTDNNNTIPHMFHPQRGEIIIQNGDNKISISPSNIFLKADNIVMNKEPKILNKEEPED